MNTVRISVASLMFADQIRLGAGLSGQRTGQYLFNHLPSGPANVVAATLFDPFHKELNEREIYDWIENHLIFDGSRIVGVFNNDQLLWEESGE